MFAKLKKLQLDDPNKEWQRSVHDPVLGELKLSGDATWWEGSVGLERRKIGFAIGGKWTPDNSLLNAAHRIIARWPEFESKLAAFLVAEVQANDFLAPYFDEIQRLVIGEICLVFPQPPGNGMIYFSGGKGNRLWRCDYLNGKPQNLGFDD